MPGRIPGAAPGTEAFAMPDKKTRFLDLVKSRVGERTAALSRKHNSCVDVSVGALTLAERWRADRLPEDAQALDQLARELVVWALPNGEEGAAKPFTDADLE